MGSGKNIGRLLNTFWALVKSEDRRKGFSGQNFSKLKFWPAKISEKFRDFIGKNPGLIFKIFFSGPRDLGIWVKAPKMDHFWGFGRPMVNWEGQLTIGFPKWPKMAILGASGTRSRGLVGLRPVFFGLLWPFLGTTSVWMGKMAQKSRRGSLGPLLGPGFGALAGLGQI